MSRHPTNNCPDSRIFALPGIKTVFKYVPILFFSSPPSVSVRPNVNGNRAPVNFCDIMTVFEKAVAEVRLGQVILKFVE